MTKTCLIGSGLTSYIVHTSSCLPPTLYCNLFQDNSLGFYSPKCQNCVNQVEMEEAWLWYGPDDPVSLDHVRQARTSHLSSIPEHSIYDTGWCQGSVNCPLPPASWAGLNHPSSPELTLDLVDQTRSFKTTWDHLRSPEIIWDPWNPCDHESPAQV